MSLKDRIPVEPLEPERLDRLEARIVATAAPALARPARHALWPWGLALASAAAAALAVYALRPVPHLPASAPVAVSTDEGATIDLGDATIKVGPATRFDISRAGGGIDVHLDHGEVSLDVAPRRGRPPLWVHAGDVGVRVVGTAFTVTRAPGAGEVGVQVEHGTVEVHRAGTIAAVTGGQRWSSRDGEVLAALPPSAAPAPAPGGTGDAAGPGRIGAAGTHTADLATGPDFDVAVLGDRRGTPDGVPGGTTGRTGGPRTPRERTGKPPIPPAEDPIGDLHRAIQAEPLAAGIAVEGATPDERVAALRRLAGDGRGASAAAALYSLARAQHLEQRKPADALRTLDAYLTRFPRGAEIEAVRWQRMRILCRDAFHDTCREAAHAYIQGTGAQTTRIGIAEKVKTIR